MHISTIVTNCAQQSNPYAQSARIDFFLRLLILSSRIHTILLCDFSKTSKVKNLAKFEFNSIGVLKKKIRKLVVDSKLPNMTS